MLSTVGEQVVNDPNLGSPAVQQAVSVYDSENMDFQAKGWWFNREYALPLELDDAGRIAIPQDAVEFFITENVRHNPSNDALRYVPRDKFVYDTVKHTFTHTQPLHADLMILVNPVAMPAVASVYLKHRCAETMHTNDDGDAAKWQLLNRRTEDAWKTLRQHQLKYASTSTEHNPAVRRLKYRLAGSGYSRTAIHTFPGQGNNYSG